MKSHRAIRSVKTKTAPINHKCQDCGKSLCPEHAYFRPDDANQAVNNNSGVMCSACYEKRFKRHIKTDAEIYKEELVRMFIEMSRITDKQFGLMAIAEMIREIKI